MSRIGRGMLRARSLDEYKSLVKDVLYEIDEIKAAFEFDGVEMDDAQRISEQLQPGLTTLLASLEDDSYQFGTDTLGFMQNVANVPQIVIPYKPLLSRIIDTHNRGLEEDE